MWLKEETCCWNQIQNYHIYLKNPKKKKDLFLLTNMLYNIPAFFLLAAQIVKGQRSIGFLLSLLIKCLPNTWRQLEIGPTKIEQV